MSTNHQKGPCGDGVLEAPNSETFLFTSESVGEGHPGKATILVKNDLKAL